MKPLSFKKEKRKEKQLDISTYIDDDLDLQPLKNCDKKTILLTIFMVKSS